MKITENKRQLVYINNVFVDTNPLVIENGVVVSPNSTNFNTINDSMLLIESPKTLSIDKPKTLLIEAPDTLLIEAPKPLIPIIELSTIETSNSDDSILGLLEPNYYDGSLEDLSTLDLIELFASDYEDDGSMEDEIIDESDYLDILSDDKLSNISPSMDYEPLDTDYSFIENHPTFKELVAIYDSIADKANLAEANDPNDPIIVELYRKIKLIHATLNGMAYGFNGMGYGFISPDGFKLPNSLLLEPQPEPEVIMDDMKVAPETLIKSFETQMWEDTLWQPQEPQEWQSTGFEPNQSAIWEAPIEQSRNIIDLPDIPKEVIPIIEAEKPADIIVVKAEVPTEVPPRVLHKAKKGKKLTEEQKAENKAIKKLSL